MRFLGRGGVGLVLVALVGVACSGGDSEPASPVSMTTTTVPVTRTVPSVAAGSTASLSTTSTSTTAPMSDEDELLAVFEAYMGFEFDERTNGYGPSEERIEQYTTGALKQRALETLQARKDADAFLVGRTTTRVESVTINGDTAEVLTCYLDTTSVVLAGGEELQSASEAPFLVRMPLERTAGVWIISEQFGGGAVACEL